MDQERQTLPMLPLTSGVVLPGMVFTLALETDEAKAAAEAAGPVGGELVLVPRIDGRYSSVGVVAKIVDVGELPGGAAAIAVSGERRAMLGSAVPGTGQALWVQVEDVAEPAETPAVLELAREYRAVLENILLSRGARAVAETLRHVSGASRIADVSGYSPDLSPAQKLQVLETVDVEARLRLVLGWARETLADIALRQQIKSDVEEGMEKTQREFLLRRQLEAIRKELGELDGETADGSPQGYREQIEGRDLPEAVRAALLREVAKLERTSEQSPEQGWARSWIETVLEIPWGKTSEDNLDVAAAGQVLDEDHDGLVDVKERILEHLAVRKLRQERGLAPVGDRGAGAVLALVGPPGVGKTSLGESVARALGRRFVRVALGGVHDEAEIRGHRRTYVGAQPGRLARALREAGTMNPVLVLDEVDKLGSDYRGDPSSALLEVLDPAQNHTFRDNYLEVELDLSQVLFIVTANVAETIPGPLLDRLEVIRLDGYTEDEKLAIARHHLLPRQLERAALRADEVEVADDALRAIAADYTREAGVRGLERELGRLLRKVATKLASGKVEAPVAVKGADVRALAGPAPVLLRSRRAHRRARRGHRPGRHGCGRRRAVRRGHGHERRRRAHPNGPARRRHEGIGGDRPFLRSLSRRGAWDRRRRAFGPALPRPRARGRRPQGRAVGGRDHDFGPGQPAHGPARAAGGGHDRGGDLAGTRATDRWSETEGPRRPPGRPDRGCPPGAQRAGPRGRPRDGARRHDLPSGWDSGRRAGGGLRAARSGQ